ncbi:MAG: Cytidylate kinase [uncultured Solirubrobacteraceae bacterium]|uniref:Cytidylate kinase n=1 Tax=uncultured Solirubrobacteraceae bacterium TaxID=1162706 RepID=A0A6J4RSY6_9ACTN|nr:MAG: Cytidylate kinase [uncultured Solirubrobacteraceae bacterium]
MLVAIDGPAGAGKSTVARAVAAALGFTYLDSGAMYRAAGLSDDPARVRVEFDADGRVIVDGKDVSDDIRSPEASRRASIVAADPRVRTAMVEQQRRLIEQGDWVAEGRDIGTVVAPDAEVKVFLTADQRERARRRAAERGADPVEIERELVLRDQRDSSREHSPLTKADDATEVDTTGQTVDEVVERIVELVGLVRR